MRIESTKIIRIECDRKEAVTLRRILLSASLLKDDDEAERLLNDLNTGLQQHLYEVGGGRL